MLTIGIFGLKSISLEDGAAEHDGGRPLTAGGAQSTRMDLRRHPERATSMLYYLLLVSGKLAVRGRRAHRVLDAVQHLTIEVNGSDIMA